MSELTFEAAYLPGLGRPALRIGGTNHTLTIDSAETLIAELQHAVLRARIDERNTVLRVRAPLSSSPASEV